MAMLGLWNAGLWLLGLVLHLEDALLTPDLRSGGPAGEAYGLTFWLAAALGLLMLLAQLLVTLLRRDARSLGAALLGCAKFVVVWAGWVAWASAVVAVCGGLTRAVLRSLLHVSSFAGWRPALGVSPEQAVDVTVATVLGLLGMVLWLAALGHVLVMLGRAVALLVLAATTPIAAAGLMGELGRGWFWRSVRWFHAAALTPLLMALLLGVGVQTTSGVTAGLSDGAVRAVGSALPGVLLILTSCFAPVALFRLLAFVDPATPSGGAFRHALASALRTGLMLAGPGGGPSAAEEAATTSSGSGADDASTTGSSGSDASADRRDDAERQLQGSASSTGAQAGAGSGGKPPASTASPTSPAQSPAREHTGASQGGASGSGDSAAGAPTGRAPSGGASGGPQSEGSGAAVAEAGAVPMVPV
ncbi:hypothetical protein [Microlunatus flavus]|uniref:hypothetical protein n=1 Tax=Microlunatus flavus TaxID=1036181 RepID=UPI001113ADBF|nr:hypothetical protein [Microlunatus flavus]